MAGATPVNQLNALPILTAETFAVSGEITIVGSKIWQKFTPAICGINGTLGNVADPRDVGLAYLLTNWLGFMGMSVVTVTLAGTMPAISGDVAQNWNVYFIPATFIGGVLQEPVPAPPGPSNHNLLGTYGPQVFTRVGGINLANTLNIAGDYPLQKFGGFSFQIGANIGGGQGVGGFSAGRLWFSCANGADPINYFATIYGQS